jgi:hypothetical protein
MFSIMWLVIHDVRISTRLSISCSSATSLTDSLKLFYFCTSLWFDSTSTVASSFESYLSQLALHYHLIVTLLISAHR